MNVKQSKELVTKLTGKEYPIDREAHYLREVDELCRNAGGELNSRQVAAVVIVLLREIDRLQDQINQITGAD